MPSGVVKSSPAVMQALMRWTQAQATVRRERMDRTGPEARISGVSGQKSSIMRIISGRPKATEAKKVTARATLPRTGCTKYTTIDPVRRLAAVRSVTRVAPTSRSDGTRRPTTARRVMAV